MVEQFFFSGTGDINLHQSDRIMLLSGPRSCGKTSLLFQFAFNSSLGLTSSNRSRPVVFVCNRRRLEAKPPFLSQGIDPSSDIFQRIQMKYVDNDEDLKKFFAAFHLHDPFPAAVIVDDFGDFFHQRNCQERYSNSRGRDLAMVRTLALCCNAIIHAKLLLSDTHHGDSPRLLFIYKRWIPSIFTVKGDCSGSFLVKNSFCSGNDHSKGMKTARYSVAVQYLVLEGITEDTETQYCH
ncbi:uncharacterized protein LOC131144356 isoform X2 [Malania oleifera]|uniref:uncharacterized protein LOC131144356 isoform X2 n=1 Tax=Malania oleifera TaxID=397392 RepID=UPI0025ADB916|nr:uncharacterized protein LOC131144356 isoform X2 [Malania oleifera]